MAHQSLMGLRQITVEKSWLIERIQVNTLEHTKSYLEAMKRYKERAIRELEKVIQRVEAGEAVRLYINIPVPEEHTPEYARAISMLEAHTEPSINLSEEAYMHLVEDIWDWTPMFAANTLSYLGKDDGTESF